MIQTSKQNDLGPRGFKLVRVSSASRYDPVAGIEWRPSRESDELFEALKRAFPSRRTHRERMCEALVQFLAEELGNSTESATNIESAHRTAVEEQNSANQSYKESKRPLFRMQAQNPDHVLAAAAPQKSSEVRSMVVPAIEGMNPDTGKKGKHWEGMTVVWKSNVGLTKGARPRRTMTDAERTDYRMRRVRGACVACKKKKRKCTHDLDPSPSSSLEFSGTPSTMITPDGSHTAGSPQPILSQVVSLLATADPITKVSPSSKGASSEHLSHPIRADEMFVNVELPAPESLDATDKNADLRRTASFTDLGAAVPSPHHASLYQYATLSGTEAQLCWDLSASELQMLDSHKTGNLGFGSGVSNVSFDAIHETGLHSYMWEDASALGFDWTMPFQADCKDFENILQSANLEPAPKLGNKQHNKDIGADNTASVLATVDIVNEGANFAATGFRDEGIPTLDEMENHWAQTHGQVHVEQWLEQKTIEEHAAPLDPELQEVCPPHQQVTASPRRRRVKFDFSTLIDGPPTLSALSAEAWQDDAVPVATRAERSPLRPPLPSGQIRSSSRHSASSRMSLSDLLSLSSAMTSLSMKDTASMRGTDQNSDDFADEDDVDFEQREEEQEDDDDDDDADSVTDDDYHSPESSNVEDDDDVIEDDGLTDEWINWHERSVKSS